MLLCLAELVVSIVFIHLLDYLVELKVELLCLADVIIFFNQIVKLLDIALGNILRICFLNH